MSSGGKVLGELGLTKAPRVVTSSANKKVMHKGANSPNGSKVLTLLMEAQITRYLK